MTVLTEPSAEEIDSLLKDTLVVVLLDRSGSMASMKKSALESLNGLIHNQKMKPDGLRFSLMFFDEMSIDFIHKAKDMAWVPSLKEHEFIPRAGTPLLDATAQAISHADSVKFPHEQVMIVIITDGLENASKEWNRETLFGWIQNKEAEGWQFIYMGANQDAWAVAHDMGIRGSAYTYSGDSVAMAAAGVSSSLTAYRSGNYTPENVNFDEETDSDGTAWEPGKPVPKRNLP